MHNAKTSMEIAQAVGFDVAGGLLLNLCTKQKPSIVVDKWEEWGKGYCVIVINYMGCGLYAVQIRGCK